MLHAALCKCRTQKFAQNSPSGYHRTTLSGYIFAAKACIDNREKLGKQQYLLHTTRPYNMVNFGPLVADICLPVWGTPANFNRFPVLASLMQRHRSTEANQTLQDVWPSPGLVHCTLYMHFRGLLSPNGILPGAKFTASKSCILLYWQRCCMVLEQWASAKLCGVQQEVPSHWASAHILVSTVLLTLKDFSMLEVGLL